MTSQPEAPFNNQQNLYEQGSQGGGTQKEMLKARKVALSILQNVFSSHHTLDQALDSDREFAQLIQRDRAFVRMLVTTVIRRLGQIDDLIKKSLSRPDQPLSPPILHYVLRMGVAQLIFMNVPDHAAVNTSVMLVESEGHGRIKGFVNALMRRIAAEGKEWTTRQDVARLNTPEWLLKIWIEDFGLKNAIEMANANLEEAPLDITVKNAEDRESLAKALEADILPTGSIRLQNAKLIPELPGFQEGLWWVQDAAAALPASLFGDRLNNNMVVDLCAAPGGKTAQLASMGAEVIAVDRSAKRLHRLQENMNRLNLGDKVRIDVADGAVWKSREKVPNILLDAPCSATGTVRRNPDVIWNKSTADIQSLMDIQARLLENALSMLDDGGTLIYCTCSLQKAEGEHQIERILESYPNVMRDPIHVHEVGGLSEIITPRGDVRILPSHLRQIGGMDGFYIARLRKA